MPFVESLEEFATRQACEALKMPNGTILFANGAAVLVDQQYDRLNRVYEAPPEGSVELLHAQRRFLSVKLEHEQVGYERFEKEVVEQVGNALKYPHSCPPPPENCVDVLKAGKARIRKLSKELAALDAQIAQTPAEVGRRMHQETQHQHLNEVRQLQARIQQAIEA